MNIADKIGLYLLLSIVFTLFGGVAGQVLPWTEATEIIIFSLATLGLVGLFAAIADMGIWILNRINQLIDKECHGRFVELVQAVKLSFYSVFYVSLYPMIGSCIYDDGGAIYAEANELMVSLYNPLGSIFSYILVVYIVIVVIGVCLNTMKKE